jgi:hypothetical protein
MEDGGQRGGFGDAIAVVMIVRMLEGKDGNLVCIYGTTLFLHAA